jgi:hypothetical protein
MYYIEEIECGVTPDTPEFKPLRYTGGIPVLNRDSLESAELDGSREKTNFRLGQFNPTGETSVELSYGSHDDLLEAYMQGTWAAGDTVAGLSVTVDATAKTFTIAAGDLTVNYSVGDIVKFPSLTGANANPIEITALTATVLTASLAKGLTSESTVTTDITGADKLIVGKTRRTFTILVHYTDLNGGAGGYDIIRGYEFGNFGCSIAVNSLASGSFSGIGRSYEADATLPAGTTFAAATTSKPFTSFDGSLSQDNIKIGFVSSIDPSSDVTQEAEFEIGDTGVAVVSYGKVSNTFDVSAMFKDYTLFDAFINETESAMTAMLSLEGSALAFTWPRFLYTSGAPDVAGEGTIIQSLTGQALKDPTEQTSLIIQRIT